MTSGYGSVGILAQSAGGAGGTGATAQGFFHARSGGGGPGGVGGSVTVNLTDDGNGGPPSVITTGQDSDAVVAQSLAGGGGYGGDVNVTGVVTTVAIGGLGGSGGTSSTVSVSNGITTQGTPGLTISTHGDDSTAITAQSIAGGGGRGGNATSIDLIGLTSVAIGGSGGDGGTAGVVSVDNAQGGAIQTLGIHSDGILAQSIGGGGGNGGGANSVTIGVQATVAVSVGGSGGTGGTSNTVTAHNGGQIVTTGSDSYGIMAQSIAGGGGVGGASVAATYQGNDPDYPSVNMKVAVGGSGGVGGTSGAVAVTNDGYIWTQGISATGILAQSISGGGGAGGDSSAKGDTFNASTITVNTTVGGSGAGAGTANNVNVTNNGLIVTLSDLADGIEAESIGGGGGNGGYGQTNSGSLPVTAGNGPTVNINVAVGGKAGSGGVGGNVTVTNTQGILTRGDSADGIFATSIGGGGGVGGAAIAHGSGGSLNVDLGLGGSGGSGNTTGTVTVNNTGGIVTAGGSANAIFAQSVGGGGGKGGNASTKSATSPETTAFNFIANGAGLNEAVTAKADGIYTLKNQIWGNFNIVPKLTTLLTSFEGSAAEVPLPAPEPVTNRQYNITIGAGFAGAGGTGGDGNLVQVNSSGALETMGPDSAGILAQSIGGGGGTGGVSDVESPNNAAHPPTTPSVFVGLGGRGGTTGDGGAVEVTASGTIETGSDGSGDLSFGIEAQSIGGGGGNGGVSTTRGGTLTDITLALGGAGGANGAGNNVNVTFNPVTKYDNITTYGSDASAILAQSIGGGGGVSKMLTAEVASGGSAGPSQTYLGSLNLVNLKLNGAGGTNGTAASVNVNLGTDSTPYGYLETWGQNAYGVLAQSIGGGGGLQIGMGALNAPANALQNMVKDSAGSEVSGDGWTVNVALDGQFAIGTHGAGAAAIFAQSIGGGGGVFGGLSYVNLAQAPVATPTGTARRGQAGDINITLSNGVSVDSQGAGAPAIMAQALGQGGGVLGAADGSGFVFAGAQPYNGCAPDCYGQVTIAAQSGSLVEAFGQGAYAVYAQSLGNAQGYNNVTVTVGSGSVIRGIGPAAAILVDGQDSNLINIQPGGIVETVNNDANMTPNPNGVAIYGPANTVINNRAAVTGQVLALPWTTATSTASGVQAAGPAAGSAEAAGQGAGGMTFNNLSGGVVWAGKEFDLQGGRVVNDGTFDIGYGNKAAQTNVNGSFIQNAGGKLGFDADFEKGQADKLVINGTMQLGGTLMIRPTTLANTPVTLIEADQFESPAATAASTTAARAGNRHERVGAARVRRGACGIGANSRHAFVHLRVANSRFGPDGHTASELCHRYLPAEHEPEPIDAVSAADLGWRRAGLRQELRGPRRRRDLAPVCRCRQAAHGRRCQCHQHHAAVCQLQPGLGPAGLQQSQQRAGAAGR